MIWSSIFVIQVLQVFMETFMLLTFSLVMSVTMSFLAAVLSEQLEVHAVIQRSSAPSCWILEPMPQFSQSASWEKGHKVHNAIGKLHDAQGREIPVESVQNMEIRLRDITGKAVLIRERVAVSSMVNQPILCFGHLLENGWCVDGQQQALTQTIELQNKSMVVQGEIRMLREEFSSSAGDFHVRAIQADVMDCIVQGTVGWELDDLGRGIGRHFADRFQDPTLIRPGVSGPLFRTTLIEGDDRKWYVVERCESVPDLIHHHSA